MVCRATNDGSINDYKDNQEMKNSPLPAVKGTGFYVPMDIAPSEYGSTIDYKSLKKGILKVLRQDWGPRCETKDTEDEIVAVGGDFGRCPVCLVYEKFDAFWKVANFEGKNGV